MAIRVRVVNVDPDHIEELLPQPSDDDVAELLTPEYVRAVNLGISYRIQQRELSHTESWDMAEETYLH